MSLDDFEVYRESARASAELALPDVYHPGETWANSIAAQREWSARTSRLLASRTPTVFLDEERGATSPEELRQMAASRTSEQRERALAGGRRAALRASLPLSSGTPFFFSDQVCALLEVAAPSVPDDATLDLRSVPCEHGFWYFNSPLRLGGSIGPIRAATWTGACEHEGVEFYNVGPHFSVAGIRGLDLVFWLRRADGTVLPATHLRWLIGDDLRTAAENGLSNFYPGEQRVHLAEDLHRTSSKLKYLMAALAFIQQRVLVAAPESLDRASRRRLSIPNEVGSVQVVTLRRMSPSSSSSSSPERISWSCRWGVSGHWRNQPVGPQRAQRRLTWVSGHVKGPSDKPLRHVERVFAVQR